MKRWVYFLLCLIFGLALLFAGWLMPIHLRAVNSKVIQLAGQNTPGLIDRGIALVADRNLGAAEMLLLAAQQEKISGHEKLRAALEGLSKTNPQLQTLGAEPRLKTLLDFNRKAPTSNLRKTTPFAELIIQTGNREKALNFLNNSPSPIVQQLLRCRTLTNTVLFPPSQSSSGQAFDAALATCGLLLEGQYLAPGLTDVVSANADAASRGQSSQPIEQLLMDFLSLAQRFNWGQLAVFCEKMESSETLRLQANLARKAEAQLPVLFSAVQLSGKPAAVAKYLMDFSQSGQNDLASSLQSGAGGVNELLKRNQRLHRPDFQEKLNAFPGGLVHLSWQMPRLALALKWFFYLLAGYLIALAMHFARPRVPVAEQPFQARGFHVAREILFALGFLLAVLLLSEPFLAQDRQNVEFPIRLKLPTVGDLAPASNTGAQKLIMNQLSLLTLLLFFVLQALLYIACLFKLGEIRRQTFPSNIKLKLLENEEHLFDAGLYLGFAGTIVSLILVSMGVIKPSLMAAYSATAFGVIFVSVFKIFHLRPLRRKYLIETESAKTAAPTPATSL